MLKELLRFLTLRVGYCPTVTKAFLSTREAWRYWSESSEGQLERFKDWSISPVRKTEIAGTVQSGEEKAQGISSIYINTWREGAKKREPGCFYWYPGIRDNGHTLKHRRFPQGNTFQCEDEPALAQTAQRGCGVPILGETQRYLEMILSNSLQMVLLEQVVWTRLSPEIPSHLSYSVIVWAFSQSQKVSGYVITSFFRSFILSWRHGTFVVTILFWRWMWAWQLCLNWLYGNLL